MDEVRFYVFSAIERRVSDNTGYAPDSVVHGRERVCAASVLCRLPSPNHGELATMDNIHEGKTTITQAPPCRRRMELKLPKRRFPTTHR